MSRLDDLPPDQRAVLMLLVAQGKSHAEIAGMLGIPQDTVRDRARQALDALAAGPGEIRGSTRERARASAPLAPIRAGTHASPSAGSSRPSSRRGGALLLVALVVAVVVAVILITSGGSSHKASTGSQSAATASSTTSTSQKTGTPTVKQIALTSPEPGSKRVGLVEVFSEGTKHGYYIAVEHLPPTEGFFYAVWLYNSPASALPLSKSPPVTSNGRLQGGALLPANAGSYHKILLTRETSTKPSHPGPIVLSGSFSLGH
jgi:hypothetical protein